MTTTPVPKLITQLAVPTIISMLVTGIYNTVDTYFVGQIPENDTQAVAAVGLVFPMMAIIQAIGFFFGHGSGNYLSRMLGAGEKEKASEMAATGFVMAVCTGIVVAVLGNLGIGQVVMMLASGEVSEITFAMTEEYGRIILIGAPFMMAQFVINNQLRFQGSAMYAMIGLLSGAIINMGLDPLLILVLGLGVRGAAIATVCGQATSFLILLIGSGRGENLHLHRKNVHINGYYILQITNGGLPSLFRQGLAAVSTTLLNRAAGTWGGDAAITGMTITTRVFMLMSCALIGFGQGYQPVCSFNYGAGLRGRVKEGYWFCVKWGTVFLTCIATVCFIFAPQVIALFLKNKNPDAIAVGTAALRCQACVLPLSAFIVMSNMMLQSIGKGVKATITASARNGLCFIPMILLLPKLFGLTGVEISQTVADVLALFVTVPLALSEIRKWKEDLPTGKSMKRL